MKSFSQHVKSRIEREKGKDKIKHTHMMNRARMKDAKASVTEYGGPPISRKEYLKQKPMQEASFADKSKASGISTSTLKKVYNRGVAAWKTGHRPGTTPSQWGHARVNAFISKKKKGGLNHDKDLA
jgi:glycerol-3-phosphate O-acyltransferase